MDGDGDRLLGRKDVLLPKGGGGNSVGKIRRWEPVGTTWGVGPLSEVGVKCFWVFLTS